ncbi:hypothetical protein ACN469_22235 [Corallococcus terminator]
MAGRISEYGCTHFIEQVMEVASRFTLHRLAPPHGGRPGAADEGGELLHAKALDDGESMGTAPEGGRAATHGAQSMDAANGFMRRPLMLTPRQELHRRVAAPGRMPTG